MVAVVRGLKPVVWCGLRVQGKRNVCVQWCWCGVVGSGGSVVWFKGMRNVIEECLR